MGVAPLFVYTKCEPIFWVFSSSCPVAQHIFLSGPKPQFLILDTLIASTLNPPPTS